MANNKQVSRTEQHIEQSAAEDNLLLQIDELQRIAADDRKRVTGDNWWQELRDIYNMPPGLDARTTPTFRPRISTPVFQMLALHEASDLADSSPKIYVVTPKGERDKDREGGIDGQWRQGMFNLKIMCAEIWGLLNGTGFIQCWPDPYANHGRGAINMSWRNPESLYADPACEPFQLPYYQIWEDRMYPDEVRNRWPERGQFIRNIESPPQPNQLAPMEMAYGLTFTPGPMQVTGGLYEDRGPSDGRVRVRYCIVNDSTVVESSKKYAGNGTDVSNLVPHRFSKKWPNGRLIIDCEGTRLFDGDNPIPNRGYPNIPLYTMPPIMGYWAPSPLRYVRDLQYTAQRMFTQVFENAVRLNNGVWFIPEETGLTAEDFGGIPAEVRVINPNSKMPECKMPPAFPAHFLDYPKFLLEMERELMGFTPTREGKPGSGNVGTELFESSVFQSQAMTRMRAKLMAASVQQAAELVFRLMASYMKFGQFPAFGEDFKMIKWTGIGDDEIPEWNVYIDPGSIRPMSAAQLHKLAPVLHSQRLIGGKDTLEMLDIPNAGELAKNAEGDLALEALANVRKGRTH
jgi:hypothetical protein